MDQPELILETERLRLRPLIETDLDISIELLADPEVVKYVCDVYSPEDVEKEMPTTAKRGAGGRLGIWCVELKSTGEKLGSSVLLPLPIEEDDTDWSLLKKDGYPDAEIEIGYLLKRSAWGKGYATEACARLLQFAFEETSLQEIVGVTDVENTASMNVLRKCGLKDEGLRRAYAEECPGFRITRSEWLALA